MRFGLANRPDESVIAQKGSPHTYVRVCQSNVTTKDFPVLSLILGLMEQARSSAALGVRWGIYNNSYPPAAVVSKLKRLGFICGRWQRRFWIFTRQEQLADPSSWSFDDSLCTFE